MQGLAAQRLDGSIGRSGRRITRSLLQLKVISGLAILDGCSREAAEVIINFLWGLKHVTIVRVVSPLGMVA